MAGLRGGRAPRFVKKYADLRGDLRNAATAYAADVAAGAFPPPSTRSSPETPRSRRDVDHHCGPWTPPTPRHRPAGRPSSAGRRPPPPTASASSTSRPQGEDLHGEARFVTELVPPPSRVLDAGCGYGRVASKPTRLGHTAIGVDADPHLIALAREDVDTRFVVADLSRLTCAPSRSSTAWSWRATSCPTSPTARSRRSSSGSPTTSLRAATWCRASGWPTRCPEAAASVDLRVYDRLADAAGLSFIARYATWDKEPFVAGGSYAVTVHRRVNG